MLLRGEKGRFIKGSKPLHTLKNLEQILEDYFERYLGCNRIAKKYKINRTTISKWLELKNRREEVLEIIKRRKWNLSLAKENVGKEGIKVRALKRRKKIKTKFTPEMAYFLGAVIGDGTVSKNSVELNLWDFNFPKECLNKGEKALGIKGSLKSAIDENMKRYYRVRFDSIEAVNFIRKFKKSTREWSVPKEILDSTSVKPHFLKGFFDAEGWVALSPLRYKEKIYLRCYVSCSSTNSRGLKQISKLLQDLGIKHGIYSYKNNYEWRITVKSESIRKFRDLIGFSTEPNNSRLNSFIKGGDAAGR